jgi:integrase
MPRQARRPRYYPSRKAYYVWFHGKQHCLAAGPICHKCEERESVGAMPTCPECARVRHQADLRFAELVHLAGVEKAEDNALLFALCNRYLKWVKEHRKERTYQRAVYFLGRFSDECGHLKVKQLKPFHVDDWLTKEAQARTVETKHGPRVRRWGRSARRMAVDIVMACLNWSERKQLITKNPIAGAVDKPGLVSRTKESLITPEEHARMLTECEKKYQPRYYPSHKGYFVLFKNKPILLSKGPRDDPDTLAAARARLAELRKNEAIYECFGLLLRLLEHTGARPGEIYNATADHWNRELGAFVYQAVAEPEKHNGFTHKTARKGKDRVIFISDPDLRAIVELLCRKHPSGPILRNIVGEPWRDNAVWWRFDNLKEKLGLNPKITPYSYRHTSITNMILAGHPWGLIAEAHGTSLQMLQRHYSHLDGHQQAMATFWAKAKGRVAASTESEAGN